MLPEEIVSQINNMFESITEIITKNDGDIDKFMGDACMSFWFDEGDKQNLTNVCCRYRDTKGYQRIKQQRPNHERRSFKGKNGS